MVIAIKSFLFCFVFIKNILEMRGNHYKYISLNLTKKINLLQKENFGFHIFYNT